MWNISNGRPRLESEVGYFGKCAPGEGPLLACPRHPSASSPWRALHEWDLDSSTASQYRCSTHTVRMTHLSPMMDRKLSHHNHAARPISGLYLHRSGLGSPPKCPGGFDDTATHRSSFSSAWPPPFRKKTKTSPRPRNLGRVPNGPFSRAPYRVLTGPPGDGGLLVEPANASLERLYRNKDSMVSAFQPTMYTSFWKEVARSPEVILENPS